jgi:hypothetical protein
LSHSLDALKHERAQTLLRESQYVSFEEKFGGPKAYSFQLSEELSAVAYDYVWARVYPSRLRRDDGSRTRAIPQRQ